MWREAEKPGGIALGRRAVSHQLSADRVAAIAGLEAVARRWNWHRRVGTMEFRTTSLHTSTPVEITLVPRTGIVTPALDWPQEATREE